MENRERPYIGVTASFFENEKNPPLSQQTVGRDYIRAVLQAGGIPIMIPAMQDETQIEVYAQMVDGLLLPGGEDVCPERYGQEPHEKLGKTSEVRDRTEFALVRRVTELGKPIFGICRGMQVLNVAFGGTLIQDIPSADAKYAQHFGDMEHRAKPWHAIMLEQGSRMYRIAGSERMEVNSFHHQAVDVVAPDFKVTAYSEEGIIEAIEHVSANIWGVQFHPENMAQEDPEFLKLFRAFIMDCCKA